MAINTATIQHRRGSLEDFNPEKLMPGELAVITDERSVYMGFPGGETEKIVLEKDFTSESIKEKLGYEPADKEKVDNEVEKLNKKIVQETGKLSHEIDGVKSDLSELKSDVEKIYFNVSTQLPSNEQKIINVELGANRTYKLTNNTPSLLDVQFLLEGVIIGQTRISPNSTEEQTPPSNVNSIRMCTYGEGGSFIIEYSDSIVANIENHLNSIDENLNSIDENNYYYNKGTPFVNPIGTEPIIDILIHDMSHERYAFEYIWHNDLYDVFLRFKYWNGSEWVSYGDYSRTERPENTPTIETIKTINYDIVIDWSQVQNEWVVNGIREIKQNRIDFNGTKVYDNCYRNKDNTMNIVVVDCNGNGDFDNINLACLSIKNSSAINQYEIVIYPGTYYTEAIDVPPYTHIHGLQPNTVIISSEGISSNKRPVFEQKNGSSKLSNMEIVSDGGYCIHFDIGLDGCTIVNDNLILRKITNGAIIGGGAYKYGVIYEWNNCTFINGSVVCHSNPRDYLNTRYILNNCKFANSYIAVGNVGGFGNHVCEINNCVCVEGDVLIRDFNSELRISDNPKTYFANSCEWQIVGGGNKNFLPRIGGFYEGLMFESNSFDDIVLSGSAVDYLFGSIKYQKSNIRIKGKAYGIYRVEDKQAGTLTQAPIDVFQMWKRLGDCSVSNKTLSVTVCGTTQTYTFNKDYLSSKDSESSIISSINSAITIATLSKYIPDGYSNMSVPEKQYVLVNDANGIIKGEFVTSRGIKCYTNAPKEKVYGVALDDGILGDYIPVWIGNVIDQPYSNGEYGIGSDGKLVENASVIIGTMKDGVFIRNN